MSKYPISGGVATAKTWRPEISDRHWGHWRWLMQLPQHRYQRAIALWHNLFRVRPRGVICGDQGLRLNFERDQQCQP